MLLFHPIGPVRVQSLPRPKPTLPSPLGPDLGNIPDLPPLARCLFRPLFYPLATIRVSAFSTVNAVVQQPRGIVDQGPGLKIFEHLVAIGLLCATTLPVSALSALMLSPIA